MAWKVYDKTGNTVRCTLKSLEYNGTWMGACFVTSTLTVSYTHLDVYKRQFLRKMMVVLKMLRVLILCWIN